MISVRPERPDDAAAIHAVVAAAFGRDAEAELVDRLRADGALLASLVAVDNGVVVGHVAFSRLIVDTGEGSFAAVALAPLAVAASHRGRGIGTRLVEAGHQHLRNRGERLAVVVGDPAYYGRIGYHRDFARGFASPWQGEAMQALPLGAAEVPRTGTLAYPAAFAAIPA
jgi:putative acetyltransferase